MNNEIGRKITSLTLMTIMLAGGMVIAAPGMVPEAAAANATLFVSAESSTYNNTFGGPQVVEIVVSDSSIASLDDLHGSPDVTVNGKDVVMAQANDGSWYAYIADKTMAETVDSTYTVDLAGLNFGTHCTVASADGSTGEDATIATGATFADASSVYFPKEWTGTNVSTGSDTNLAATCDMLGDTGAVSEMTFTDSQNVVRGAKALVGTIGGTISIGQIDLRTIDFWPFIQTYDFTGSVTIEYNKAGVNEISTLTFDSTTGLVQFDADRTSVPLGGIIHIGIGDPQLNIDPTSADLWTFTAATGAAFYMDDATAVDTDSTLMFEDNGVFKTIVAPNDVVTLAVQTNADVDADGLTKGGASVTGYSNGEFGIFETGANTSYFTTYDSTDTSTIIVATTAVRGQSGTIDYNDSATSFVVTNTFGEINMDETTIGDEWNSGEAITVVLNDTDLNKNTRSNEDLDVYNSAAIIPALQIGSPFTLEEEDTFFFLVLDTGDDSATIADAMDSITDASDIAIAADNVSVESFSKRALINDSTSPVTITLDTTGDAGGTSQVGSALVIGFTGRDMADLKAVVLYPDEFSEVASDTFDGFNYFNYDIRTFNENQAVNGHAVIQTDIFLVVGDAITSEDVDSVDMNEASKGEYCLINIAQNVGLQGQVQLGNVFHDIIYTDDDTNGVACNAGAVIDNADPIGVMFFLDDLDTDFAIGLGTNKQPIVADFFSFGDSTNSAIYRMELAESGDNTSEFIGSVEYIMLNQLNGNNEGTFGGITSISSSIVIIAQTVLTDEDAPRVNYLDLGADGVSTQIADQQDAPSHSGVVDLDLDNYKVADTVIVTLTDMDLNVDSGLIDVYITKISGLVDDDTDSTTTHLLDITFNDVTYTGLDNDGFVLVETDTASGTFTGSFQVPATYDTDGFAGADTATAIDTTVNGGTVGGTFALNDATDNTTQTYTVGQVITAIEVGASGNIATHTLVAADLTNGILGDSISFTITALEDSFANADTVTISETTTTATTTGTDIEVNYNDHRDASGNTIEVGDGAGIRANTGSISLDRTVYPVPWGIDTDFAPITSGKTPNSFSIFPVHATGITGEIDTAAEQINTAGGDLNIHVRVADADLDLSAVGEDKMNADRSGQTVGPIKITVSRGNDDVTLAYAGGDAASTTRGIVLGEDASFNAQTMGPVTEVAGDTGIFELDFTIRYTDGPASTLCPITTTYTNLIDDAGNAVEDRFRTSANGNPSAALQLLNYCILQGDILTVEYTDATDASGNVNTVTDSATFDLRNGVLQSDKSVYIIGGDMILTIIEPDWDLDNDGAESYDLDVIEWDSSAQTTTIGSTLAFDPEPSKFRETGDSTGIFQVVIEIPDTLDGTLLDRGEQIDLEYTDWGPSGANYVGAEDEDIGVTVYTSNFGATIELDQKVYTWTDKVYITIVAPDHNFDSNLVDTIGDTADDSVKISTRSFDTDKYSLVETGTDTGIFTGEIILTGFSHAADGTNTHTPTTTVADGSGPTDGFLETSSDDGLTVSFEYSSDATVVGSALIRWNIGEVQFLEASYPASGTGVVRVIDPDMNLNPEAVDNFNIDTWSDSDAGGISLTVTETNEATGIFEGTVFFTTTNESSGHRLRVAEGDTVTSEYEDNTLPDPYTTADELDISATTLIGTVVPPLERAPAANLRTVDAFGNSLDAVSVDQQVQISADLANGQDREQAFAYLVQIQDGNGVTVSLAWITGQLSSGQSFSPALSWIPTEAGTYTATAFVWESIDNPTALSPPVSTTISVS